MVGRLTCFKRRISAIPEEKPHLLRINYPGEDQEFCVWYDLGQVAHQQAPVVSGVDGDG
jgi:hypothetical protein